MVENRAGWKEVQVLLVNFEDFSLTVYFIFSSDQVFSLQLTLFTKCLGRKKDM